MCPIILWGLYVFKIIHPIAVSEKPTWCASSQGTLPRSRAARPGVANARVQSASLARGRRAQVASEEHQLSCELPVRPFSLTWHFLPTMSHRVEAIIVSMSTSPPTPVWAEAVLSITMGNLHLEKEVRKVFQDHKNVHTKIIKMFRK